MNKQGASVTLFMSCQHDTQQNDIQYNYTQHSDIQHKLHSASGNSSK
jgi:hypothetical protein